VSNWFDRASYAKTRDPRECSADREGRETLLTFTGPAARLPRRPLSDAIAAFAKTGTLTNLSDLPAGPEGSEKGQQAARDLIDQILHG